MSWTSLSGRLAGLPLILAGPILRRVTPDSVSVWVALRQWKGVTLSVSNADGTLRFASGSTPPISLGTHLHIVCVTAKASGAAQRLVPGQTYSYDLDFGGGIKLDSALKSASYSWNTIGIGGPTPRFSLPAATLAGLSVAVGSCRKPHGGGDDATVAIEQMLTRTDAPPPQLLILCGDQIYADDVSCGLLHSLMDATRVLMDGWDEEIPGLGRTSGMKPGSRAAKVKDVGFTAMIPDANHAKSHLMALGEYVLMHVFAWSDVLWPTDLADYQTATGVSPGSANSDDSRYQDELELVADYRAALKSVRRVLANVATYMIFDDHEITDDWYINRAWCAATLGSDGGRRIIANGLSAFALCQAWGNDPGSFEGGNGRALLEAISAWAISRNSDHLTVQKYLLPPKSAPLALVVETAGHEALAPPPESVPWHFSVDLGPARMVVVDTRTRREFSGAHDFPLLLSRQALDEQLPQKLAPVTLLVLPAPLAGQVGIELYQRKQTTLVGKLTWDCEAPGLQPAFFERLLATLAMRGPDDPEQPGARRANVVIISGDVHYGYASELSYSSKRAFEEPTPGKSSRLEIVQFTASALKNTGSTDGSLTWVGEVDPQRWYSPRTFRTFGYTPRSVLASAGAMAFLAYLDSVRNQWKWCRPRHEEIAGADADLVDVSGIDPATRSMMPEPNWSYTVGGLTDERFFTERDVVGGAQVVGYNNAGYFRFAGTEVICELWWRPIFGSQFLAATKYHAPFLAGEPRYWWNGP